MNGSRSWERERNAMLAFALRWAPFGGGSVDDIWVTFGVSERVYFLRLQHLLGGHPPANLDAMIWARLRRVCAQRLTAPESDTQTSPVTPGSGASQRRDQQDTA